MIRFDKIFQNKPRKQKKSRNEVSHSEETQENRRVIGYTYDDEGRVLSATDISKEDNLYHCIFTRDKQGKIVRELRTYSDGDFGYVRFIQYNADGSVVSTRYCDKNDELLLFPGDVEISLAQSKDFPKVYQVAWGNDGVELNYDVAQKLRLPELFGSNVMQKDAFTFFDAYPWFKDSPEIRLDRYPWLKFPLSTSL